VGVFKRVGLGICLYELDLTKFRCFRALPREFQHGCGKVGPGDKAGGGHAPGNFESCRAAAAAQVKHVLSRLDFSAIEHGLAQQFELGFETLIHLDPFGSGLLVPILALLIVIVS